MPAARVACGELLDLGGLQHGDLAPVAGGLEQLGAAVVVDPDPRERASARGAGGVAEDEAHATAVGVAPGGWTTSGPIRSGIAVGEWPAPP